MTNIDLSNCRISALGNIDEFSSSLRNIQILNISRNIFTNWLQVVELIVHMPALKELIVSGNPMQWNAHDSNQIIEHLVQNKKAAPQVRQITMGSIVIGSWDQALETLSSIWKTIDSIDMWNINLELATVKPPQSPSCRNFVSAIRSITLSENSIQSISQIDNLGELTSLEELDISKCCLEEITIDDKLRSTLRNLKRLNVAFNNLTTWKSIAELNNLPSLHFLLCQGNPIINPGKITKMMVIGRVGGLTCFNREEISPPQRKDSELFYMRKLFDEYLHSKENDNGEFFLDNPRYEELLSMYGMPEDLRKVTKKKNYFQIYIQLKTSEKTISKKLPSDMPISNLKMLSKRLFGLSPCSDVKLVWYPKGKEMSCVLDKDGQGLSFYSIKDEDTIVIEHDDC